MSRAQTCFARLALRGYANGTGEVLPPKHASGIAGAQFRKIYSPDW
jgi:hypothetical protein